jgi:hypothetical protein
MPINVQLQINIIIYLLSGLSIGLTFSIFNLDLKILVTLNTIFILLSLSLSIALSDVYRNPILMKLIEVNQDENMRCLKFSMLNNNYLEGEELFEGIYKTLLSNDQFIEFGFNKIIILSVTLESEQEYNLHCNILINNDTTLCLWQEQYYEYVSPQLSNYHNLQYGYHNEAVLRYNMLTWNADDLKNKKIKQTINTLNTKVRIRNRMSNYISTEIGYNEVFNQKRSFSTNNKTNKLKTWYKGLINPISILNKKGILKQQFAKPFFTIDLETITINSIETVVVIVA